MIINRTTRVLFFFFLLSITAVVTMMTTTFIIQSCFRINYLLYGLSPNVLPKNYIIIILFILLCYSHKYAHSFIILLRRVPYDNGERELKENWREMVCEREREIEQNYYTGCMRETKSKLVKERPAVGLRFEPLCIKS